MKYALIKEALKNKLKRKHTETLGENVEILHEEVDQWNYTVNKMRQDYEEAIHLLMPETFENKWVENIEKKLSLYGGNNFLCSLLVLLLTSLFILTHKVVT